MFCTECGTNVDGACFCPNCGKPVERENQPEIVGQITQDQTNATVETPEGIWALKTAGEQASQTITFGEKKDSAEILSPVKAILGFVKGFFDGIQSLVKKPWRLIPFAILVIAWILLWNKRDSSEGVAALLSWLTFTEGGMQREGIPGIIGGTIGKGMTGAAILSVFMGGIPALFKSFPKVFKGMGKGASIPAILFGVAAGAALYLAFAGFHEACADTAMVGISGVILSLEALGASGSWTYVLATSLTSMVKDGVRTLREKAASGLLTGVAIGFAVATIAFTIRG